MIPPSDRTDPADDPARLRGLEIPRKLELGQGPKEPRPRRAQVEKIDKGLFGRGYPPRTVPGASVAEKERGIDVVNGHRSQGGRVCPGPGDGHGIEHGGDLGDHPVMAEGRLKRDVARVGRREVAREGEGIDPFRESTFVLAFDKNIEKILAPLSSILYVVMAYVR